jgi:hypothetical protein
MGRCAQRRPGGSGLPTALLARGWAFRCCGLRDVHRPRPADPDHPTQTDPAGASPRRLSPTAPRHSCGAGQLEITAIAHGSRRCVAVFSADAPLLLTGSEYECNGKRLQLAYHRHYYGLGEHYNSLVETE